MFGIKIGIFEVKEAIYVMQNCSGSESNGGWLCNVTKFNMEDYNDKFCFLS